MTGIRTGGAGGFSSGDFLRGSTSGSGSSNRGDEYESSLKNALHWDCCDFRIERVLDADGEKAFTDNGVKATMIAADSVVDFIAQLEGYMDINLEIYLCTTMD